MKRRVQSLLAASALLLLAAGCGSDDAASGTASAREPRAAEKAASGLNAMKGLGDAMSKMKEQAKRQQTFKTEPVDFRTLRALLPETVAGGLERTSVEGQKGGAMGMAVSSAEAAYEGSDGRRLTIKITDLGSVSGFAMMGLGWAMIEVDKETSSGYERTTEYKGHRAYENYDRDRQRGGMQALVADRFVVEVEGRAVEMEAVAAAMDAVDVSALEGMKDEGVTRRAS